MRLLTIFSHVKFNKNGIKNHHQILKNVNKWSFFIIFSKISSLVERQTGIIHNRELIKKTELLTTKGSRALKSD